MHTSIPGAIGTLFGLDMAVKQYIEENVSVDIAECRSHQQYL